MTTELNIEISAASAADFDEVKQLYLLSDDYHYCSDPSEFKTTREMGVLRTKEGFVELLKISGYKVLVAKLDGQIIGLVAGSVSVQQSFILAEKLIANIDEVTVHPNYSGQGFAKKLIFEIENHFQKLGVVEVLLNVYAFNDKAKALYESLNYQMKTYKMCKKL